MRDVFKRLMAILATFAFIIAMSVQAVPSADALGLTAPAKAADMDEHCPRVAAEQPDAGTPQQLPCKGIMLDCVKQMGCVGSPNLPSRSAELRTPVSYSTVVYWSPVERSAGLTIAPDLLPPRDS